MTKRTWMTAIAATLLAQAAAGSAAGAPDGGAVPAIARTLPAAASPDLGLLSYNVKGLPWPFTRKRARDERHIAAELSAMRGGNDRPQVVLVQEAFRHSARQIGASAGYAYAAYGAGATSSGAAPMDAADRAFAAGASRWRGEDLGKHIGSGLAVFSDYPILWTRRMAFPAFACAGWDCLANKGALAVALQVPGVAQPVIVVDTHLNSRTASGRGEARSLYAYGRQVAALVDFVARVSPRSSGLLLAGDFNVGHDPAREAILRQAFASAGLVVGAKEDSCGGTCRRLDSAVQPGVEGAKTILAYHAGGQTRPGAAAVGFGTTAKGRMLSDHVGVWRDFKVG